MAEYQQMPSASSHRHYIKHCLNVWGEFAPCSPYQMHWPIIRQAYAACETLDSVGKRKHGGEDDDMQQLPT
eukprot:scaffold259823_cov18-Prasinocladus_malaysianus.AAC.1